MIDIDDALKEILAQVQPLAARETLPLDHACGRILAENVLADIDVPPADNSAMDGYALDTEGLAQGDVRAVSQRIAAGQVPQPLNPDTVARIFTGANVPVGANAVVMQENCTLLDDGRVRIDQLPNPEDNIRPQGQDIGAGTCVLTRGELLTPQSIGLLASIGVASVSVSPRLKVSLLSTGDELINVGELLAPGQIYNSNQPMLAAALAQLGCDAVPHTIVADSPEATTEALRTCAARSDLVISCGGVSVGEEDHVKGAVEALGELSLWKVRVKPGKPLAFGHIRSETGERATFMGLPGNPVSAFVTFALFAIPVIKQLRGQRVDPPVAFSLPANFDLIKRQSRPEFIRARIASGKIERFPNQSSGVLTSVCWADALALVPANTPVRRGDLLTVYPLDSLMS